MLVCPWTAAPASSSYAPHTPYLTGHRTHSWPARTQHQNTTQGVILCEIKKIDIVDTPITSLQELRGLGSLPLPPGQLTTRMADGGLLLRLFTLHQSYTIHTSEKAVTTNKARAHAMNAPVVPAAGFLYSKSCTAVVLAAESQSRWCSPPTDPPQS